MQSYFALIEDVFSTLLKPPWPLYVFDETESPAVGLQNIHLFVTEAKNTLICGLRYLMGVIWDV